METNLIEEIVKIIDTDTKTEFKREITIDSVWEQKSKETGEHSKRVAEYSKLLALKSGLNETEAELLHQAAPLHDLGKISTPSHILNKQGILTKDERIIMNAHAEFGYTLLKDSKNPVLHTASIIAIEHHEKWNGTGYPYGLKGENINILGRITAVADIFDALGADRIYKKAWKDEEIVKFFIEEKGRTFDPLLIDTFLNNINDFISIRSKFN